MADQRQMLMDLLAGWGRLNQAAGQPQQFQDPGNTGQSAMLPNGTNGGGPGLPSPFEMQHWPAAEVYQYGSPLTQSWPNYRSGGFEDVPMPPGSMGSTVGSPIGGIPEGRGPRTPQRPYMFHDQYKIERKPGRPEPGFSDAPGLTMQARIEDLIRGLLPRRAERRNSAALPRGEDSLNPFKMKGMIGGDL